MVDYTGLDAMGHHLSAPNPSVGGHPHLLLARDTGSRNSTGLSGGSRRRSTFGNESVYCLENNRALVGKIPMFQNALTLVREVAATTMPICLVRFLSSFSVRTTHDVS